MEIVRCSKGHFYDSEENATCPMCAAEAVSRYPEKLFHGLPLLRGKFRCFPCGIAGPGDIERFSAPWHGIGQQQCALPDKADQLFDAVRPGYL